jgi:rhodanese-related sulfurtransferase
MKIKYWIHLALLSFLLNLLFTAGCIHATTQTSSYPGTTLAPTSDVPTVTTLDAYNLIQKNMGNPDFAILDVRTVDEFNSGHIASAIDIDYYSPEFQSSISKLDKNKRYLVYCKTGIRGAASTRIMIDLGFKEVQNLSGGITQWIQDGYPIIR